MHLPTILDSQDASLTGLVQQSPYRAETTFVLKKSCPT